MKQKPTVKDVSRETLTGAKNLYEGNIDQMDAYLELLLWWNRKVNLVSRDVSRETLREHLVHSLIPSVMGLLKGIDSWIDAGSGGGLPGIPLAIAEPGKNWSLNDIVTKKIAALRQMIYRLELENAVGISGAVSDLEIGPGSGIVTKHAFSVADLLGYLENKQWKKILMLKGSKEAEDELRGSESDFTATVFRFEFGPDAAFYQGKGILVLERQG